MFQVNSANKDREGFLVMHEHDDYSERHGDDKDLAHEVASRTILHWNYRRLKQLPTELLS